MHTLITASPPSQDMRQHHAQMSQVMFKQLARALHKARQAAAGAVDGELSGAVGRGAPHLAEPPEPPVNADRPRLLEHGPPGVEPRRPRSGQVQSVAVRARASWSLESLCVARREEPNTHRTPGTLPHAPKAPPRADVVQTVGDDLDLIVTEES